MGQNWNDSWNTLISNGGEKDIDSSISTSMELLKQSLESSSAFSEKYSLVAGGSKPAAVLDDSIEQEAAEADAELLFIFDINSKDGDLKFTDVFETVYSVNANSISCIEDIKRELVRQHSGEGVSANVTIFTEDSGITDISQLALSTSSTSVEQQEKHCLTLQKGMDVAGGGSNGSRVLEL